MLRMKNINHKRSSRKKHSSQTDKNTEKTPNYEENYNEVILNDLVPESKKVEFGLEEEEKPKTRKGKTFSLGLGKKKTSNKESSKKQQSSKTHKENSNESSNKKSSNKKVQDKPQDKEKNTKKATSKKNLNNTHHKKESRDKKLDNTESEKTKTIDTSHGNKHHNKRRVKKTSKEDYLEVKQNTEDFEENLETRQELDYDKGNFRSVELEAPQSELEEIQEVEEIQPRTNKLENIVWSKETFPKK